MGAEFHTPRQNESNSEENKLRKLRARLKQKMESPPR